MRRKPAVIEDQRSSKPLLSLSQYSLLSVVSTLSLLAISSLILLVSLVTRLRDKAKRRGTLEGLAIGVGLIVVASVAWSQARVFFPPPKPVVASNVRSAMHDGLWRVSFDLEVVVACQNIIYRREFLDESLGSMPAVPVASSSGERVVNETFAGRLPKGEYLGLWTDFTPVPGSKGNYRLLIHPGGTGDPACLEGGAVLSVPYDFTAMAARQTR